MGKWSGVVVVLLVLNLCLRVRVAPQVPRYFIFGDSLVNNGNNNRLSSLARVNYLPYGIDFPNGPTGRFSNGKTTVDVIDCDFTFTKQYHDSVILTSAAQLLGFDNYIPPYSTASGGQILGGGARMSFSGQVKNYQQTIPLVVNLLGDETTAANYKQYNPEQFADVLIQEYTQKLQVKAQHLISIDLYTYPPVLLKGLVDQFNNADSDAKFIYINAYGFFQDITSNPSANGCCGVGRNNGQITCLPAQTPCPNRNDTCFGMLFIQLRLQMRSLGGDLIVLSLHPMLTRLISAVLLSSEDGDDRLWT
ncbi:putative GDSL-like Lipase/Acylhydrolase superfamily protein [Hibiscus syriacus]|uniref:GDSL-like Lipase/Acylhydrolase superfamily protein n=1 Tax=Hibiscus syriacus TaxID=106335 RepID=A0A6A3CZN7_HIBSY|nr:putative GDSL-like Lipase/Acylhydrolase superfamily protein [Hibiscus syriacus]